MKTVHVPDPGKADGKVGTGGFANGIPKGATPVPNPDKPDGYDGLMSYPNIVTVNGATSYVPNAQKADGAGVTPSAAPAAPPNPPVALAASGISSSSFAANWTSDSGATGYYIDVSTVSDFASFVTGFNNLQVVGGSATSASVTGLVSATTYYYRLRVYSGSGTSGNSNVIAAQTHQFIPSDIAGLSLWLDANSIVASPGDAVVSWSDQSPLRNTPAAAGVAPTYSVTALNGYPGVVFDGASTNLDCVNPGPDTPVTVFVVCASAATGSPQGLLSAIGSTLFYISFSGFDQSLVYYDALGNTSTIGPDYSYDTAALFALQTDGVSVPTLLLNGSDLRGEYFSSSSGGAGFGGGSLRIGSWVDGYYYFNGVISEVIVYDSFLGTVDRKQVEHYLSVKWGLGF